MKRRVHVYSRSPGEWVVFASGRFHDHVVFADFEPAVRHGRRLADACGGQLQAHGPDGSILACAEDAADGTRRSA